MARAKIKRNLINYLFVMECCLHGVYEYNDSVSEVEDISVLVAELSHSHVLK